MPDTGFGIGDNVRSFDFAMGEFGRDLEGDRATFIEGTVIAIDDAPGCAVGCLHYHIEVTRDVCIGIEETRRIGDIVYPPIDYVGVEQIS